MRPTGARKGRSAFGAASAAPGSGARRIRAARLVGAARRPYTAGMRRRSWTLLAALAAGAGCSAPPPAPAARAASPRAASPRAASADARALTEGVTKSADGQAVAYRSGGRGETALVFVHGWCIEQTYWDAAMTAFAPRARVVSLDLVGHGRSGRGRASWTVESYARDVAAVIDALGLRRVALVGHSMSGYVAVEVARSMPDRVAALVAVDTLHDAKPMATEAERREFTGWMRADFPAHGGEFAGRFFLPGAPAAPVERVRASVAQCPAETAVASLDDLFQYPTAERLPGVRAPIVCLNAGLTKADPEGVRRHAARYEVVSMPGVGHYPMIEDPPRFHALLDESLRRAGVALPSPQ